jgi:hypothetical protein
VLANEGIVSLLDVFQSSSVAVFASDNHFYGIFGTAVFCDQRTLKAVTCFEPAIDTRCLLTVGKVMLSYAITKLFSLFTTVFEQLTIHA